VPDQTGKTMVVTGANAGLGYYISEQLAKAGARIILACRNPQRAQAAIVALRGRVPGARVEYLHIDVGDLESVRAAAAALLQRDSIDVIVENAGIVNPPARRETTVDGNELVLGTNVLGHFALTALLMPVLERTPGSRIITMGSLASRLSTFRVDDLQLENGYSSWRAYAQSKIALQSFGFELDRRLRRTGSVVSSLVAHPGYSVGGIAPRIQGVNEPGRGLRFVDALQGIVGAESKERGAWSAVRAATDPDAVGGQFWGPRGQVRGLPTLQKPSRASIDPLIGAKVWSKAEEYTSQPFPVG
jgi:NAD(P)-dependent dehydrogenase (short-subunit alcohol dehydrogenase family)